MLWDRTKKIISTISKWRTNGFIGEPKDTGCLVYKMVEVAEIPADILVEMGTRGRKYGLKHFSKAWC